MTLTQILTELWPIVLAAFGFAMWAQRRQVSLLLTQVESQSTALTTQDEALAKMQQTSIETVTGLQKEYQAAISRETTAVNNAVDRETKIQNRLMAIVEKQAENTADRNRETKTNNERIISVLSEFSKVLGLTMVTQEGARQFNELLTDELLKMNLKIDDLKNAIQTNFTNSSAKPVEEDDDKNPVS